LHFVVLVFLSHGIQIHLEEYCWPSQSLPPAVIFLNGAGGPHSNGLPYKDAMQDLAKQGYCAFAPPLLIIHRLEAKTVSALNASQLSCLYTLRDLVCDVQLYPKEGHNLSNGARIKATRELESFLKEHVEFGALP
jgi:hypothetical protein